MLWLQRPGDVSDPPADDPAWSGVEVSIELWRDYAPEARDLPGIALGTQNLAGDTRTAVTQWHDAGVRYAQLTEPVQLCADVPLASARALILIRELTARGIALRWIARCDAGCADHQDLAHLFPPTWVFGAPNTHSARWRAEFHPTRCVFRRGPDFLEVRDRRFGPLNRRIITDQQILDTVDDLLEGIPEEAVPADVRTALTEDRLVVAQAGRIWWLPTPAYVWPFPSMEI